MNYLKRSVRRWCCFSHGKRSHLLADCKLSSSCPQAFAKYHIYNLYIREVVAENLKWASTYHLLQIPLKNLHFNNTPISSSRLRGIHELWPIFLAYFNPSPFVWILLTLNFQYPNFITPAKIQTSFMDALTPTVHQNYTQYQKKMCIIPI